VGASAPMKYAHGVVQVEVQCVAEPGRVVVFFSSPTDCRRMRMSRADSIISLLESRQRDRWSPVWI